MGPWTPGRWRAPPVGGRRPGRLALRVALVPELFFHDRLEALTRAVATCCGFLVALALSLLFPALTYWPVLVLLIVGPVTEAVERPGRPPAPE